MYYKKFVLSIMRDGYPVKETGSRYRRQIALPFGSEYKIRLKNKNGRSCTARVFIDGKKVSALGDFILSTNGTIDLERFVDASLDTGKRFKFVSLDHRDVDDPTSSENGIIKVEFRLAKEIDWIYIDPKPWTPPEPIKPLYDDGCRHVYRNSGTTLDSGHAGNLTSFYCNSGGSSKMADVSLGARVTKSKSSIRSQPLSAVSPGATVEGRKSNQQFNYSHLEVGNAVTVLKLKMVGIDEKREVSSRGRYCTKCGNKIRKVDKYCAGCGRKL